jgi:hypothetical protein
MIFPFVAAFLLALIFGGILSFGLKRKGPGPMKGLLFYFLLILFTTWAIGNWVHSVGPDIYTVPWVTFLIVAIFVTLFITVLVPPERAILPDKAADVIQNNEVKDAAMIVFGLLFWVFIIALVILAISRGMYEPFRY